MHGWRTRVWELAILMGMRDRHILPLRGIAGRHVFPAHGPGLAGAYREKRYGVLPIPSIEAVDRLHQFFRLVPGPMLRQQRELAHGGRADARQHDAGLLVGMARLIDLLQAGQGGTHQQAGIRTRIGQRDRDAVAVLRVLLAERIGLHEYLDGFAHRIFPAKLFRRAAHVAGHGFAQLSCCLDPPFIMYSTVQIIPYLTVMLYMEYSIFKTKQNKDQR